MDLEAGEFQLVVSMFPSSWTKSMGREGEGSPHREAEMGARERELALFAILVPAVPENQ